MLIRPGRVDPREGDDLELSAADFARAAALIERVARVTAAAPLAIDGGPGVPRTIRDGSPRGLWGLLSGSSSPYSWTEQLYSGGAWIDGLRTGTASAVEVNGRSGLSGQRAWLISCEPGTWCFQHVKLGTSGGGGGITIPSCYCASIPATLYQTVSAPDPALIYFDATLVYGSTPPEYAALSLGSQCYLSAETFLDANGESFRYYFGCIYASFNLSRVWAVSSLGSPYQDIVRYTWSLGFSGNICSPFLLSNGRNYSGANPAYYPTISQ